MSKAEKDPSKFTLDQIWHYQLEISGSIARQKRSDHQLTVSRLKHTWLIANGFKLSAFTCSCFFCTYAARIPTVSGEACSNCPGCLVEASFDCLSSNCNYFATPTAFYQKLLELNKIRTRKRKNPS